MLPKKTCLFIENYDEEKNNQTKMMKTEIFNVPQIKQQMGTYRFEDNANQQYRPFLLAFSHLNILFPI